MDRGHKAQILHNSLQYIYYIEDSVRPVYLKPKKYVFGQTASRITTSQGEYWSKHAITEPNGTVHNSCFPQFILDAVGANPKANLVKIINTECC